MQDSEKWKRTSKPPAQGSLMTSDVTKTAHGVRMGPRGCCGPPCNPPRHLCEWRPLWPCTEQSAQLVSASRRPKEGTYGALTCESSAGRPWPQMGLGDPTG